MITQNFIVAFLIAFVLACSGETLTQNEPPPACDSGPHHECETPGEVQCVTEMFPGQWGNIRRCREDYTWELGGCLSPPYCRAGACSETP